MMIEFKNIEIRYGDFVAIKKLNMNIQEGEFFTFLGPSGCGKTTTLRTLVGFLNPSSGTLCVDGEDITHLPVEKRQIGMVFQSYALFSTMSVYDNLAFGLKVKKMKKDAIHEKILDVAKKVQISDAQLKRNVSELSGGQQQRVALARAIILEPKILCLDEPLSNLDARLRIDLRGELRRLQKMLGITMLYVTHDQEEALTLSDRIAVFNNGYVEQIGTPYEVYNQSKSEFVCDFIGDINRLEASVLQAINEQMHTHLKTDTIGFLRIERMHLTSQHGECASFLATVKDFEYNGVLTKYVIEVLGQQLKIVEKNDGNGIHDIGDVLTIYINPDDIMQF